MKRALPEADPRVVVCCSAATISSAKLCKRHETERKEISLELHLVESLSHKVGLLLSSGAMTHINNTESMRLLYHVISHVYVSRPPHNIVGSNEVVCS